MKKIKKSMSTYLPPVRLYYDDVEEIVNVFTEVCDKIEIVAKEYQI